MLSNEEKVLKKRSQRNAWFLKSFDVLTPEEKLNFQGLDFYPLDSQYSKVCDVQVFEKIETAIFAVEGFGEIQLRKYGFVNTEINDQKITLYLYSDMRIESPTELFAPFKDTTNGKTTYGGGRNLEVQIVCGKAVIDFNEASNMECAYSSESVCAMPLPENWLSIAVPAGEKVYEKNLTSFLKKL